LLHNLSFTEEELVTIANHTTLIAHAATWDTGEFAWREVRLAVSILDKIEAVFAVLMEAHRLCRLDEMIDLRRQVASGTADDI